MNPLQIVASIAGAAVVSGILWYLWDCETTKTAMAKSVLLAEQARDRAEKKAKEDQKAKEKSDEDLKAARGAARSLAKQLRESRARGSVLPTSSPSARFPHLVCFDRSEFERATGRLDEGLSGLAEVCDQRTAELANARKWASERR